MQTIGSILATLNSLVADLIGTMRFPHGKLSNDIMQRIQGYATTLGLRVTLDDQADVQLSFEDNSLATIPTELQAQSIPIIYVDVMQALAGTNIVGAIEFRVVCGVYDPSHKFIQISTAPTATLDEAISTFRSVYHNSVLQHLTERQMTAKKQMDNISEAVRGFVENTYDMNATQESMEGKTALERYADILVRRMEDQQEPKKSERWEPKEGELVYVLNDAGEARVCRYRAYTSFYSMYMRGCIFPHTTEGLAQATATDKRRQLIVEAEKEGMAEEGETFYCLTLGGLYEDVWHGSTHNRALFRSGNYSKTREGMEDKIQRYGEALVGGREITSANSTKPNEQQKLDDALALIKAKGGTVTFPEQKKSGAILYKLTDKDNYTRRGLSGETLWGAGVERMTDGVGNLCGSGFTHAYTDPLLAVLLDPIHGKYGKDAVLWECEGDVAKTDHGLKVGCTRLRTVRVIDKPVISDTQRTAFGILCALEAYREDSFVTWANDWLDGSDRSEAAAEAAWAEAWAAAPIAYPAAINTLLGGGTPDRSTERAAERAAERGNFLDLSALARRAMEVQ